MLYIEVDLGASAVKLLLMDGEGAIKNTVSREYPSEFAQPGWNQQNPEDWKKAVLAGIPQLLEGFDASQVAGIGAGGQMHGLVVLDSSDSVIRPAILWNDRRTAKEVAYLNETVGREKLSQYTANIAFAGSTAPKLLWMRENEPELFEKIAKIMLPKDYIHYILTGVHCTDYSDASRTLLLDVKHRRWSKEMLELCGVTEEQMPKLFESYETVGTVKPDIARQLGIPENVKVYAGAGDNAAVDPNNSDIVSRPKDKPAVLAIRVILLLAGLIIAHLGVTLFLESNLGSDPFNVLVQGLYRSLSWPEWMTHGRVHLVVSLGIVAVLLFAARSYVRIGTVLCMALGGPIIDLWSVPIAPLLHDGLAFGWRLLAMVLGCVILAFGMTMVIRSEAGTGPNDLVAVVISDLSKKPFGAVRVIVDLAFALTGWLLGGVVGVGTLVCAGLVGPCAQVFLPVSGKICGACLKKFGGDSLS